MCSGVTRGHRPSLRVVPNLDSLTLLCFSFNMLIIVKAIWTEFSNVERSVLHFFYFLEVTLLFLDLRANPKSTPKDEQVQRLKAGCSELLDGRRGKKKVDCPRADSPLHAEKKSFFTSRGGGGGNWSLQGRTLL